MKPLVLHVITGLGTGGAEMMLLKVLTGMRDGPFSSAVISLSEGGQIADRIRDLSIPLRVLNLKQHPYSPVETLRLARAARSFRPAVIQGWMYHGNLGATLAAAAVSGPVPVAWNIRQTVYDLANEKRLTKLVIQANAKLSHRPARIVYNSRVSATQHEALGFAATQRQIIPNGFDCERFRPSAEARAAMRAKLGIPAEVTVIGLVARLHPMKDHAGFLDAARNFLDGLSPSSSGQVRFLMVGTDVDRSPELREKIAALSLTERVHLLSERSDLPQLMPALDVLALTSRWGEAFPNVVGEAMACGTPCAVTDVGDAKDVVGDTGFTVPAGDPRAMAEAWRKILAELQTERLGERARARIVQRYSLASVVETYASLYATLRREPAGTPSGE